MNVVSIFVKKTPFVLIRSGVSHVNAKMDFKRSELDFVSISMNVLRPIFVALIRFVKIMMAVTAAIAWITMNNTIKEPRCPVQVIYHHYPVLFFELFWVIFEIIFFNLVFLYQY